jgi:hypothetical protein
MAAASFSAPSLLAPESIRITPDSVTMKATLALRPSLSALRWPSGPTMA